MRVYTKRSLVNRSGRLRGNSIVYTTFGDRRSAARVSKRLVEERLTACANAFPLRSTYRWRGEVRTENEIGVFLKTTKRQVPRLLDRLRELHPYENPCAIEIEIARGRSEYLAWIHECTGDR